MRAKNAQILSNVRISSKTDFMKNSKFDILLVEKLLKKILLTDKININSYNINIDHMHPFHFLIVYSNKRKKKL